MTAPILEAVLTGYLGFGIVVAVVYMALSDRDRR